MRYHLRPLRPEDSVALHDSCWPEWSGSAIHEMLERVQQRMSEGRALALVGQIDDQIIAFGQLTLWPHTTEISDLVVAAPWRNHGLGTAIICSLIDTARAWDRPCVEIGVALSNPRAMALYRRLGFQDDRQINLDLGQGEEPVLYLSMALDKL